MPRRDFTVRHVKPKMPIKLDVLGWFRSQRTVSEGCKLRQLEIVYTCQESYHQASGKSVESMGEGRSLEKEILSTEKEGKQPKHLVF